MNGRRPKAYRQKGGAAAPAVYKTRRDQPDDPDERPAHGALREADWDGLLGICDVKLSTNPTCGWALRYRAFALGKQGRNADAEQAYLEALKHAPQDDEVRLNWANWLLTLGRPLEAIPVLETLTRSHPDHSMSWSLLASGHYQVRGHQAGFVAAQKARALAHHPAEISLALQQLAIHRRELGQIQAAIRDCEEGLKLDPNDLGHHTNRLLFLLADPDRTAEQLRDAAADFAQSVEAPWVSAWPTFADKDRHPNRRLRVGFLSPDFRDHSVMYFTEGLLAQLDRDQFDVVALHLHPAQDAITTRVKAHADQFVNLAHSTTDEVVQRVRALDLDILIDLAGHTGHNALAAMARKLAPLQVSTLGYPGTTGLKAIDYRISDPVTDPPEGQALYAERLWRLDTLFCVYRPCIRYPLYRYQPAYAVQPAPALTNGFVTFGSCTNLGRLTDTVLHSWGEILHAMPTARLLVEGKDLDDPAFANAYLERCKRLGLPVDRLDLVGMHPRNQYLTYHRIDIALDPFPLNSGTTSFDGLWMGVPFITLAGEAFKGRIGAGILTALGLDGCIAQTAQQYVDAALSLAADVSGLNALRLQLRPAMEASVLMNERYYSEQFGRALRQMWWAWVAPEATPTQQPTPPATLSFPPPGPARISLAPGQRPTAQEAYGTLDRLIGEAKRVAPDQKHSGRVEHPSWIAVQDLAEAILNTLPNDAMALSALAEIEMAHGHESFAAAYLGHAMRSMEQNLRDASA